MYFFLIESYIYAWARLDPDPPIYAVYASYWDDRHVQPYPAFLLIEIESLEHFAWADPEPRSS
jgi:hypothetical protein